VEESAVRSRMVTVRRLAAVALAAAVAAGPAAGAADVVQPAGRGPASAGSVAAGERFVTLVAGRSFWEGTDARCVPYGDAVSVDLGEVAAALKARARPLPVHGLLQGAYTAETERTCGGGGLFAATFPSWSDTAVLRDTYGWTFGSNGRDLNYMTQPGRTQAEQWSTSCGALRDLRAHGHTRGWALFAYPGGGGPEDLDDQVQRDVVSPCFSWARRYTDSAPFERNQRADEGSRTANPLGWAWAHNIYGGRCHLAGAPCSSPISTPDRVYDSPQTLAQFLRPAAGEWSVLQFHAFVTGARLAGSGSLWDCRSPDWRAHWTTRPEFYCWQDFLTALDALPADVTVADPVAVAQAWGRQMLPPVLTAVSPARGPAQSTVTLDGRRFRAVGSADTGFLGRRGFAVRFGAVQAEVLEVTATSVTARVPGGQTGTVDVTVVNADGTQQRAPRAFTYTAR
jgi:hypothetical protein